MLYLKDTEKWKQFTTNIADTSLPQRLCCISKIQKNESNSQLQNQPPPQYLGCVVSQRYRKMKAIHNSFGCFPRTLPVVLYLKDTEKWKQFTTVTVFMRSFLKLCCISKIQKNESNSQRANGERKGRGGCVVSQRYRKMKAIHNCQSKNPLPLIVVLYLKDTEKWKQFTTAGFKYPLSLLLCCISKIQKNESNSQLMS